MSVRFELWQSAFRWHVIEVATFPGGVGGVPVVRPFRFRRGSFWRWQSARAYAEYLSHNSAWADG